MSQIVNKKKQDLESDIGKDPLLYTTTEINSTEETEHEKVKTAQMYPCPNGHVQSLRQKSSCSLYTLPSYEARKQFVYIICSILFYNHIFAMTIKENEKS